MKLLQNLIYQMRDVVEHEIGILDENLLVLACSDESRIGDTIEEAQDVLNQNKDKLVLDGFTYRKIFNRGRLEFIVYINAEGLEFDRYITLIAINVENLKFYYDEKFDKGTFIKNIILDNIMPGDIALRAKELHVPSSAYRVAFLIKSEKTRDLYAHDIIQGLFPNRQKDFIVMIDEESTVLIKELRSLDEQKEIDKLAKIIIDTLNSEIMVKVHVGIGTIVDSLKDLARTFKEAQLALHIGNIFEGDKYIVNYNMLGIGRLIYQLPTTLCRLFLREVFPDDSFDSLDKETILTIQKFFENNLNVSETSRQLYVHRNTLVYRLDKIQKITGLDLRNFDNAIIFKVAMLVKCYLDRGEVLI